MQDEKNKTTEAEKKEGPLEAPLNKDEKHQIHVKIYAPFKTYYDDFAKSVSAVNATGPFDILPKHHNFVTLLSPCDIVVRMIRGEEEKIRINRGIMIVKAHKVVVFLNI